MEPRRRTPYDAEFLGGLIGVERDRSTRGWLASLRLSFVPASIPLRLDMIAAQTSRLNASEPRSNLKMSRLAAQAVHRNRESSTFASACFPIADATEVVLKTMADRLSVGTYQFLFLVMSLSGSKFLALHSQSNLNLCIESRHSNFRTATLPQDKMVRLRRGNLFFACTVVGL